LLFSSRAWDDVIYRDELERLNGNALQVVHTLTRFQPPGWSDYARRVDTQMLAEVRPQPSRAAARLRLRADAVRRDGGRSARAARARSPSDQNRALWTHPDGDMDELMLDGNAVAGLLQEVFAVEMNDRGWNLWRLRRSRADRCRARLPRRWNRAPLPPLLQRASPRSSKMTRGFGSTSREFEPWKSAL